MKRQFRYYSIDRCERVHLFQYHTTVTKVIEVLTEVGRDILAGPHWLHGILGTFLVKFARNTDVSTRTALDVG